MSRHTSDPDALPQFRRRWSDQSFSLKFLSEMTPQELDRLVLRWGREMLLRRDAGLEKRDPARFRARALRLGRARLQTLEARRERERGEQEPRGGGG
jgi:hypothetical protein